MPEYLFNFTTTGQIRVIGASAEGARHSATVALEYITSSYRRATTIETSAITLTGEDTPSQRMDAAVVVLHYRNLLARTEPHTPERAALCDLVRWFTGGTTAHHAISLARTNAQVCATALAESGPYLEDEVADMRTKHMVQVYNEFLRYTQPQEES